MTYKEHYIQISQLGAFSIVHIAKRKEMRPGVSVSQHLRSFKTPSKDVLDTTYRAVDKLIAGVNTIDEQSIYPHEDV